jgi:hypothetical protein
MQPADKDSVLSATVLQESMPVICSYFHIQRQPSHQPSLHVQRGLLACYDEVSRCELPKPSVHIHMRTFVCTVLIGDILLKVFSRSKATAVSQNCPNVEHMFKHMLVYVLHSKGTSGLCQLLKHIPRPGHKMRVT